MSTIQITGQITFTVDGAGVVHLSLSGTTDCHASEIILEARCNGKPLAATTVALVGTTGSVSTWEITDFPVCQCGVPIEIFAKCGAPQTSAPYNLISTITVPCPDPPPPDCCPVVTTSVTLGDCEGLVQAVTFQSTIVIAAGCPDAQVTWNFGDSSPAVSHLYSASASPIVVSVPHDYACGETYIAIVSSLSADAACPAQEIKLDVPCCDETCCPTLSIGSVEVGLCDTHGHRPASFPYSITPAVGSSCPPVDGTLVVNGITTPIGGALSGTVQLPSVMPGNYSVVMSLTSPSDCGPVTVPFEVPPCDCCPVAVVTSDVSPKCNSDHETKHVKVSALITPKPGCQPVTAQMSVDGQAVGAAQTGSSAFTLTHDADYGCGTHPVAISFPGSHCPDGGGEFCVSVCETLACKVKRWLFETFAMPSIVMWVLYFSNPVYSGLLWPAIIFTVIAVVRYSSWKPCLKTCATCLKLLVLWEVLLGSFMAFLCLSFLVLTAMWTMTPVYLGLIWLLFVLITVLVIYLLYLFWVSRCCPTTCDKWTALLEAMTIGLVTYGGVIAILATLAPPQGAASNVHWGWLPLFVVFFFVVAQWVLPKFISACE